MHTYLVYIDDSGQNDFCIYTAVVVREDIWHENFNKLKKFRQRLRDKYKLPIHKELHATELAGGRGMRQRISKENGAKILDETIQFISSLEGVLIFNSCINNVMLYYYAFERLLNRIERTMKAKDGKAIIISDEGKESIFIRLRRKMGVHNPIPSNQTISDTWVDTGNVTKNIPLENILEDIVFLNSKNSYFIQLADVCAYVLLRFKKPLSSKSAYGLDKTFLKLDKVLFKEASKKNPYGIIE